MTTELAKPHHHGDLRRALVNAGMRLLAEGGLPALTLRACAARAGVSHAAPAHHFAGLPGLLAAIATEGYRLFTKAMLDERAKAADNPRARLEAICKGYLNFAAAHPALFNLMFGPTPMPEDNAEVGQVADAAYDVLVAGCAPFVPDGQEPIVTEMTIWSLVHGFALLLMYRNRGLYSQDSHGFDITDLLRPFFQSTPIGVT